ncbi:MAG: hypothetical protein H6752_01995 [Candidatus Omnitrophica bacterium]|nr:hypothetical protein [Candidatus Omnitrophota bacterium]
MNKTSVREGRDTQTDNFSMISIPYSDHCEYFVTVRAEGEEGAVEMQQTIESMVAEEGASIVSQDVFISSLEDFDPDLEKRTEWPLTWVIEDQPSKPSLTQSYVWAVAGIEAQPISIDNRVVGIRFEDDSFRYVRLGGLLPEDPEASLADQSRQMFRQMILGLGQGDMGFNDVVRTWFFNRDILSWYSEFNQVRNDFFRNQRVFEGLVPASTGIGGNNPFNAALTGGLLAVQPKTEKALVHVVPSPLQNSALEYGSSFSRAVELTLPTSRRLLVSGTASIGPDGLTRHVGDVRAQMEFTLEVVQEILQSREMDWPHVVRAYAYLRETEEEEAFWAILKDHHLDRIPLITACQTICRDDLLFEIEVEARGPHHELPKNRRL